VLSQRRDESHKARGRDNSFISKTEAVKGINMINHRFQDSVFSRRLLLISGMAIRILIK
jgi:hypothetical protein